MAKTALGAVIVASLAWSQPALAQPDTRQACTDAYVANQKLRKDGKLTLAREQLLLCAQESCPAAIKSDCVRWLGELEQNMPSIVVDAKGRDGKDTTEVRVLVDGEQVADKLDGRALALDPGEHRLRFEHRGAQPIEQRIVVQEGVKNRAVSVSFAVSAREPNRVAPDPTPPAAADGPPVPWAVVAVIGVVSVGAFATFAAFGILGKREADELDRTCGENAEDPMLRRTCTDEQISDVREKLIVADAMLGVGAVTAAVALGLLIWNVTSASSSTALELEIGPTVGGAYAGAGLRF